MNHNIAIDGPAGAGKSTIAKKIAEKLNFIYVDTGAMYRAMGLYMLVQGIDINNEDKERTKEILSQIDITITYENKEQQVILNGENVTGKIRTEEAGKMASEVGKNQAVRIKLVELQQKLAEKSDVVMDGRDIGTVVLPNAFVKIYLTASAETRAERRYLELENKGISCDLEEIKADIIARDKQDMEREVTPLCQAEDAVLVDSSQMNIEEVIAAILQIYQNKS